MMEVSMKRHFVEMFTDDDFDILLLIGGYGSGKSFTGFLKTAIKGTMEKRKILVVRKVYSTIKESCFEDLKDGLEIAGVLDDWKFIKSPLEATNVLNGSKIIFRGMDDWRKIKSIKNIDYIIVEEADELSLDDLKELRKRLRVVGIKKHIVFMCNPVSRSSSVYQMFFTENGFNFDEEELYEKRKLEKVEVLKLEDGTEEVIKIKIHHSTYKDNPFLPPTFIYELESEKDPRLKRIACEGKFGADGDLVLHNAVFEENVFERYVQGKIFKEDYYRGVDWGYSKSYATGLKMAVNESLNELYIYWESYNRRMTTRELVKCMEPLKEDNVKIFADSASAQTNADFKDEGFRIFPCDKSKGIEYGEQMLRSFSRIVIDKDRCPNTKKEAEECIYKKDKYGEIIPGEYNIDPHTIDTMRYGLGDRKYVPLKQRKNKSKFIGA
ncbi:PBSX family phage terminase large subunit [Cetobacterium somerae]|uniref:PBSX family phage terminase large subunit n=1 Tax=Cetobacterium somerae TaxID=188913 RepID=UPI003D7676E4